MAKWVKPCPVVIKDELIKAAGHPKIAEILYRRGYHTPEEIDRFLHVDKAPPPDFSGYPAIDKAADYILQAVQIGKKICIWGDYDVDGVTSTALMFEVLESLGADVMWHVPDRFTEGYGLNTGVIEKLANEGIELIVTCDCGIANIEEVRYARTLGLDVIITDHHELPPVLPEANVTVNMKMLPEGHPARDLPGVGTAFLVACAILKKAGRPDDFARLLDLVVLGIIADVVPLVGENRRLLSLGFSFLVNSQRPGIRALFDTARLEENCTEQDIAFQLIPRLNAAGRLEHAGLAVELLLTRDEGQAQSLSVRLDELNARRKDLVEQCVQEAREAISGTPRAIVLHDPFWHPGVIGITAGRLCEMYNRPVVLLTTRDDGLAVGSARSVKEVNIFEALQKCSDLLIRFGGHAGAAGCSLPVENVPLLAKKLNETVPEIGDRETEADLEINFDELDMDFYQALRVLGPFGEGNPPPVLFTDEVNVLSTRATRENKHLQLVLGNGFSNYRAIWWWAGNDEIPRQVRVAYTLELDRYAGDNALQLNILGIEKAGLKKAIPKVERDFIDMRGVSFNDVKRQFPNALYFCEGQVNAPGVNRYQLKRTDTLVLLSIPAGPKLFREVLALSGAKTIVLAYPREIKEENILAKLGGAIKYAVKNYGGHIAVPRLAPVLNTLENVIWLGLEILAGEGLIGFETVSAAEARVFFPAEKKKWDVEGKKLLLAKIQKEIREFCKFMVQGTAENITIYFRG